MELSLLVQVGVTLSYSPCFLQNKLNLYFALSGDEDEGEEQRVPSCFDYFMHILCLFWKILFAFVPPTEYWNGWACFFVSIGVILLLTAIIGDLASHFGCTVGLRDTVTAVVFVALGTSLPGEFILSLYLFKYYFFWLFDKIFSSRYFCQ